MTSWYDVRGMIYAYRVRQLTPQIEDVVPRREPPKTKIVDRANILPKEIVSPETG